MEQVDVVIIGAGPAGLCFANSLADLDLKVVIIDRNDRETLENPAFDGREIALNSASCRLLEKLGIWQHFDPNEISVLRDAHIRNSSSPHFLQIRAEQDARVSQLGSLVPNHLIRAGAYKALQERFKSCTLLTNVGVTTVRRQGKYDLPTVELDDGRVFQCQLLVSADSRFSVTRRMMGIGANMLDFGKTMMVARFQHSIPHQHVALEWFGLRQTVALLPLNNNQVSVVLTLPHNEMLAIYELDKDALAEEIQRRIQYRLGDMELVSTKHLYPLVGVYARRFVKPEYALIGDAAVGMHPVTAHGFNLGLASQELLSEAIRKSRRRGAKVITRSALNEYQKSLDSRAWPIYQGTNLVVRVFTDDRLPVRALRHFALGAANMLSPLRHHIAGELTSQHI